MTTLEPLLRRHPFLESLNRDQIRFLTSCARNTRFAAGEFLMREGDEAATLFLIRAGQVSLEVHVPGRGTTQVESVLEGDILGLSWLFPPHRCHLDARAGEPVRALAFDGSCLREKMEADHDLGYVFLRAFLYQAYQRLQRVRLQRLDLYGVDG